MTDKTLRLLLYDRQRKLLGRHLGYESVCLPGQLLAINPNLLAGKLIVSVFSASNETPKLDTPPPRGRGNHPSIPRRTL